MIHADQESAVASLALDHQLLTAEQAAQIVRDARNSAEEPIKLLLERALIDDGALMRVLAAELNVEYVDLFGRDNVYRLDPSLIVKLDATWLRRFQAIPLVDLDKNTVIATSDPSNAQLRDYIEQHLVTSVRYLLADPSQVRRMLDSQVSQVGSLSEEDLGELQELETSTEDTEDSGPQVKVTEPVVQWVDSIMEFAAKNRASDIHLERQLDKSLMVRLRIDGELSQQAFPLRGQELRAIATLMTRSGMSAANMLVGQDGSFSYQIDGRKIDVRAAMLPAQNGPKVVLRLLDPNNLASSLADTGFAPDQLDILRAAVMARQGTILAVGPTGSGKSTTLYGLLTELTNIYGLKKNIQTIEDPVEYKVPLVSQTQVRKSSDPKKEVTFASALRIILRMDPDVVLVGEIRDTETARVSMEAAITGHLVLSTLHASSSPESYTRLIEMGVPRYMVGEAISLILSQRLVRRLHSCARQTAPTGEEQQILGRYGFEDVESVWHPNGCRDCNGRGYSGRLPVAELLVASKKVKSMISAGAPISEVEDQAASEGFRSMVSDAFRHVVAGATSIEEAATLVALQDATT